MNAIEQKAAAQEFAEYWKDKGYEKGQGQVFWIELLQKVLGVETPTHFIQFEEQVKMDHTAFIDGYIPETKVLIEQKGSDKDLRKPIRQSDGSSLTPFQQAKRYIVELPVDKHPRWVITCNFHQFLIYDMNQPNGEPEEILLKDLPKEYYRLEFLVKNSNTHLQKELEVSVQAGELVGLLYDAMIKQYKDPEDPISLRSLNMLCVRLVFCLYAEDAGIFGHRGMFNDYMKQFPAKFWRAALKELFQVLDTKEEDRDRNLEEDLAAFPYVNGGLFADENIEIPAFTEEIVDIILNRASNRFDWSEISPTIFGAVFESTLNPETRRSGGMHYTSIENIHKVIDPLFLDELQNELQTIRGISVEKTRERKLHEYQEKLSNLMFLDPACGSGNFLTETYISLRRLENEVLNLLQKGQISLGFEGKNSPIKISISQFFGIEINDFAVTVAKTALWIAESQMMKETEEIVHMNLDFLPLKTQGNIHQGNALEIDWETVISKSNLSYIMGNPPFIGGMYMSEFQKLEIRQLFNDVKGAGEFDYVTGWYKKAAEFIRDTHIQCAFVSTNSICQGSQVITFWKNLIEDYNIQINYAYTTFVWNSEAKNQAKVHCIIVSFSNYLLKREKKIFSAGNKFKLCEHISPYLTDTPTIFIESRSTPICMVPQMRFGSMPRDGGGFILSPEEKDSLVSAEPLAKKWIRPYIGAIEFLNGKERYCLWMVGADPSEIAKCPTVKRRIEHVREVRASSKAAGTRKFASTPTLFCQIAQPESDYIIVPKTSSGKRRYIPLGFMDKNTIASDLVFLIPNAGLYEFGILMSNVHNSWMRLVAGRLKSDYRYAKDIVYNNFPWPEPSSEQKAKICQNAQGILDARKMYPNSTLANLYDDALMPLELREAHRNNDRAVMEAYGFNVKTMTESGCVAELMKLYQKLINEAQAR